MKAKTKKKICGVVGAVSMFYALGVVGAVEHGAPLSYMALVYASIAVSGASLYKGGYLV